MHCKQIIVQKLSMTDKQQTWNYRRTS